MRTLLVPLCPLIIAAVCSITVTVPCFISSRVLSRVRACCLSWQAHTLSGKDKMLDINFIILIQKVDRVLSAVPACRVKPYTNSACILCSWSTMVPV